MVLLIVIGSRASSQLAVLLLTLGPLVYTPFATYLNCPSSKGLSSSYWVNVALLDKLCRAVSIPLRAAILQPGIAKQHLFR